MKKVILGSVLAMVVVTANAATASQTFCTGASNQTAVSVATGSDTDNNFVKAGFTPKCSANVSLVGIDGGVYYTVGAGSSKGKTSFRGSSAGGGIVSNVTCATTGCNSTDASTAAQNAPSS